MAQVMLAPNPNRLGAVDRVIVLGKTADQARLIVLNIDALAKNPQLMKRYGKSYLHAVMLWNAVSTVVLVGGIAASFIWHWWLFLVGFGIAIVIHRSNQRSAADFAQEILADNPEAYQHFVSLGLVWDAAEQSLVP
jgi:hypothetical protein